MWPFKTKNLCTDKIWQGSDSVYCQFSATGRNGSLTVIPYKKFSGVSAFRIVEKGEGFALTLNDSEIEIFSNLDAAKRATDAIADAIKTDVWRFPSFKLVGLSGAALVCGFFVLVIIGNSIKLPSNPSGDISPMTEFPGMGKTSEQNLASYEEYMKSINKGKPNPFLVQPPTAPQIASAPAAPLSGGPEKINLKDIEGLSKIPFGRGKPVLYVFADPTCQACKDVEEKLHAMKISFSVIPVAIKGEDAAVRTARVMCSKNQSDAWMKEITGQNTVLETQDKAEISKCAQKVIENMIAFRKMGMTGTPTMVNATSGRAVMAESQQAIDSVVKANK